MSAKLTVVLFIMICFEIGGLLLVLPWHRSWQENSFLYFLAEALHAPWLTPIVASGYFRGLVSGIGLVNVLIGIWEIFNFRATVRSFAGNGPSVSHQ
jgi:hypothetical protein